MRRRLGTWPARRERRVAQLAVGPIVGTALQPRADAQRAMTHPCGNRQAPAGTEPQALAAKEPEAFCVEMLVETRADRYCVALEEATTLPTPTQRATDASSQRASKASAGTQTCRVTDTASRVARPRVRSHRALSRPPHRSLRMQPPPWLPPKEGWAHDQKTCLTQNRPSGL